jgi:hypothetical protein
LKDDKAGKLDSLNDILSTKKKKGAEEEEEVDSNRTKKRWTLALVLQMSALPIPVPWLPRPLKLPRRQSHQGTPRRGRLRLLRFGFSFSHSNRLSCGWKDQLYVLFWMEKIDPLFSCSVNLVVVGKSHTSPVIHEEH